MTSILLLVQKDSEPKMSLIAKKKIIAKNAQIIKAITLENVHVKPSVGVKMIKKTIPKMSSPIPSSWIISATS